MSALDVSSSRLYADMSDITKPYSSKYQAIFNFETVLHITEKDLDYTDSVFMSGMHIVRDYVNNMSDYIELQLSIPLGTFLYDVYDYLDNIEVTLITTKQLTNNGQEYTSKDRYKAVYLLEKNSSIPNTINQSKNDLNNTMPVIITLQLLDRSAETIRIKTTQGNFDKSINGNKDMSINGFMKSLLSEQTNKILIENKPSIDNIFIETPDNKDKLKAITIPSGTRIVELPDIIQNKNIGIYTGGVGIYVQKFGVDHFNYKKVMFIYSLYNGKKYNDSEFKTLFFSPLTSSHSIGDLTYKYQDKILRILPHSITKIQDNKETSVMSSGSGFRTSNANSFMAKPVVMKPSGPVFKKDQLSSEVIFKDRKDGLNFAPNKSVSGNQFKHVADLLKTNGNYITVEVSNLDPDFISPQSKCKVLYEGKTGNIDEVFCVFHQLLITFSNSNPSPAMSANSKKVSMTSHVVMQLFCNSN